MKELGTTRQLGQKELHDTLDARRTRIQALQHIHPFSAGLLAIG